MGGTTLHFFFQWGMNYIIRLEDDSEEVYTLQSTQGLIIDEFTMVDRRAWNKARALCKKYPLREDLRKPSASEAWGYRDVILFGDLFQLPPASGFPPLVTHPDFQKKFVFFVFEESRRQETNQ